MAGVARYAMGGAGMVAGLISIGVALIAGTVAALVRSQAKVHSVHILALAAVFAPFTVLAVIPGERWSEAVLASVGPLALINGLTSLAAAYAIVRIGRYRDEQHLLRAALAQAPNYLYVKDVHSRFVAVNDAVAAFNGYKNVGEMIGESDFELNEPARAKKLFHAEQALMQGGDALSDVEEQLVGSDGESRWFVTSKRPILDATGTTVGLVGVTRDISSHRKLEDELRASRDLLSHALAEMSDGVAMFNADGALTFSNDRYRSSFPRTHHVRKPGVTLRTILEEVVRTGEQLGAPQADAEGWIAAVLGSLKSGGEEQVQLFDGRWLHIRTRVASDGGAMVVVSDVTAIKKAETELLGLTAQLRTLASTDALTGLANRRAFDQVLALEMTKCQQLSKDLALLMIDVDHFKAYNDLYGHPTGDDCLRSIGQCLSSIVTRSGEVAARYGGEEFAVILPGVDTEQAGRLAERIVVALEELALEHRGNSKALSASASASLAPRHSATMSNTSSLVLTARSITLRQTEGTGSRWRALTWLWKPGCRPLGF
jgi:diguanylate cyclase (GGDEF)-like protein/PAS domain S-box-containing protein